MISAKKIRVKRILAAVGGAMLLCVLAVLAFAWRSMSFEIEAATVAEAEETFALRFDDFAVELPKSFKLDNLHVSLNWPEARILVNEKWWPNREEARRQFEGAKEAWAGKHGEVIDVSGEVGLPAVVVPRLPAIELADRPSMMLALTSENVQLNFILMNTEPLADPELWKAELIRRARDFARFYHPSPTRTLAPEAAGSGMRALYGTVEPGPRDGYVFTLGYAYLSRDEQTFQIYTITEGERSVSHPGFNGKISRFFLALDATGNINNGIGLKELSLGGVPGHEIIGKTPYLGDGPAAITFDWQENPKSLYAKRLILITEAVPAELPAVYGQWKQILESVRFTEQ